jgi:hypothetical protein
LNHKMADWGEWRQADWQEQLIEHTRVLFQSTADRHGLRIEWDDDAPVYLACKFPQQPGLRFDIWASLDGDEMRWDGDGWSLDRFPADRQDVWDDLAAALDGLVTGEARVLLYRPLLRTHPHWSVVQLKTGDGWKDISTRAGCAIPPVYRVSILQNRDGGEAAPKGTPKVAWGCVATLGLFAVAMYYIFS